MLLPVTWLWTATLALVPLDILRTTVDVNVDPAAQRATAHARYELVVLEDGVTLVPLATGTLEVTTTRVDGVVTQAQTQDGTTVVTLPAAPAGSTTTPPSPMAASAATRTATVTARHRTPSAAPGRSIVPNAHPPTARSTP